MDAGKIEPKKPKVWPAGERDHPEQYPTDKESLFDMYESERNVDAIPMEDLGMGTKEEQRKEETKHHSSSEEKYEQ